MTTDRGVDYIQKSRTFVFPIPDIDPGQKLDFVAVVDLGGAPPTQSFLGINSVERSPRDLYFTVGRRRLSDNLAEIATEYATDTLAAPIERKFAPTRVGFGQRKVQYILFFCYIGLATTIAVVWAVWYSIRLVKKPQIKLEATSAPASQKQLGEKTS